MNFIFLYGQLYMFSNIRIFPKKGRGQGVDFQQKVEGKKARRNKLYTLLWCQRGMKYKALGWRSSAPAGLGEYLGEEMVGCSPLFSN